LIHAFLLCWISQSFLYRWSEPSGADISARAAKLISCAETLLRTCRKVDAPILAPLDFRRPLQPELGACHKQDRNYRSNENPLNHFVSVIWFRKRPRMEERENLIVHDEDAEFLRR
jgi:hypothetical protein